MCLHKLKEIMHVCMHACECVYLHVHGCVYVCVFACFYPCIQLETATSITVNKK